MTERIAVFGSMLWITVLAIPSGGSKARAPRQGIRDAGNT